MQGSTSISGTISGTDITDVKVGAFSSNYWFIDSWSGDDDIVAEEFNSSATSGEFTPLKTALNSSGAYTLDLPSDPATMGNVIAWDDADGDGIFDMGTESGYFAVKTIGGIDYVLSEIGYMDYSLFGGSGIYYVVSYYVVSENMNYIEKLDTVGNSGFNFSID